MKNRKKQKITWNRMKTIFLFLMCLVMLIPQVVLAGDTANTGETDELSALLYAKSAVLMDAQTGRVLFSKNGEEQMPNASTTKILTCLVALENSTPTTEVTFSAKAAAQPKVKLGAPEGSTFYMQDMLLAMMLESFNDTAVAIAETIAGSTEEFAKMLNKKAMELGCENTHFVTPNGLDASDDQGSHSSSAKDLATIMAACIQNEEFLAITQTMQHSFSNIDQTANYSVSNKNAFLTMMAGVISGKTGFTGAAGYCYVCAYEKDGRQFTLALLACGWPNNRTYKWKDATKLIEYGNGHFEPKTMECRAQLPDITVYHGTKSGEFPAKEIQIALPEQSEEFTCLMGEGEQIEVTVNVKNTLEAPVLDTQPIGTVQYYLGDILLKENAVYLPETIEKNDLKICFTCVWNKYCQLLP